MPSISAGPRSTRGLTDSPPSTLGVSQSQTISQGHQAVKVVSRLALEGKAKQGEDGARMLMYLKISIPADNATPGATIPLFPEENIKITGSQIHPLDSNSAPYNFSSSSYPVLHNAARALNLPSRSSQSYLSLFSTNSFSSGQHPGLGSANRSPSSNGVHASSLDEKYTGHILVSGYNVSYVLPKEFPSRFGGATPDTEGDNTRGMPSPFNSMRSRRGSIGEKNAYLFMAAIEMWVPLLTKPPRAPHLLSIPVPRCLLNNIKLRIVPAANTRASQASLSSAEGEFGPWDLTSDPHIARSQPKHSRSSSYVTQLADDESSDSSVTEFSDSYRLQGTFPSTDRVRVRWASPLPPPGSADGRHRAGVMDVQSELACAVLGTSVIDGREGVLVRLEYTAACRGVWHEGVATLLGLDVGLDTGGCELFWPDNTEPRWTVTGSTGFTGWDAGASRTSSIKRDPSIRRDPSNESDVYPHTRAPSFNTTSTSLLRQPLPGQVTTDFSFESAASTPTGSLISSVSSLHGGQGSGSEQAAEDAPRPPAAPLTLHVNMNDLLPTSRDGNTLTFQVAGTVLVLPPDNGAEAVGAGVFMLPRFRVLAADGSVTHTMVRNEAHDAVLEIFLPKGDLRDAQTRKTVLQRGARTRCGPDGARIALRPVNSPLQGPQTPRARGADRERGSSRVRASSVVRRGYEDTSRVERRLRPRRDGPPIIPTLLAEVALLHRKDSARPDVHAVRLMFPTPDLGDESEWLEFGLARERGVVGHQRAEIVCASIEGVPVRMETSSAQSSGGNNISGDWLCWVKIKVGNNIGATVVVDYVVQEETPSGETRKGISAPIRWHLLLPSFSYPIGRYEVSIEKPHGQHLSDVQSGLSLQQTTTAGYRLIHHSLDMLANPRLSLFISPEADVPSRSAISRVGGSILRLLPHLFTLVLLLTTLGLYNDHQRLRHALVSSLSDPSEIPYEVSSGSVNVKTETVVFTSTGYDHMPQHTSWPIDHPPPSPGPPNAPVAVSIPSTGTQDLFQSSISHTISVVISADPTSSPAAPEPESQPTDPYALGPAHSLPFSWPLKAIWEMPESREAAKVVTHGIGRLWQVFRRMYHYPLDPP